MQPCLSHSLQKKPTLELMPKRGNEWAEGGDDSVMQQVEHSLANGFHRKQSILGCLRAQ